MANVTVVKERIDAKVAERYLNLYRSNRAIRQSNVDRFSALLRNKCFRLTHQGIAFHEGGWLCDGQHRLWAVIETNIAADMFVTRGLDDEAVTAIDHGLVRDLKDDAHYAGSDADPFVWTVARTLVPGVTAPTIALPFPTVNGWYEFYKDGIDFSIEARNACRPMKKQLTAAMCCAFVRAWYGTDDEAALRSMLDIMRTGQLNSNADKAATVLRDVWLSGRIGGRVDQYFKTCAAIRAFIDRRAIKTLQRAEIEVWKLPKLPSELQYATTSGGNSPRSGPAVRERVYAHHAS